MLGVAATALVVGVGCAPSAFKGDGPTLPGGLHVSFFGGPQVAAPFVNPMVEQDTAAVPEQSGTSEGLLPFAMPMATDSQATERVTTQATMKAHVCPFSSGGY